jgi:hypothetical protein
MIARCYYKTHPAYHLYGGRGVGVCDRWLKSFPAFLEDMGERPEGLSLDRIEGGLGYNKENCRWATTAQQLRNREVTVYYEYQGRPMTLAEAVKASGCSLPLATVASRIWKGASLQDALTRPKYAFQKAPKAVRSALLP